MASAHRRGTGAGPVGAVGMAVDTLGALAARLQRLLSRRGGWGAAAATTLLMVGVAGLLTRALNPFSTLGALCYACCGVLGVLYSSPSLSFRLKCALHNFLQHYISAWGAYAAVFTKDLLEALVGGRSRRAALPVAGSAAVPLYPLHRKEAPSISSRLALLPYYPFTPPAAELPPLAELTNPTVRDLPIDLTGPDPRLHDLLQAISTTCVDVAARAVREAGRWLWSRAVFHATGGDGSAMGLSLAVGGQALLGLAASRLLSLRIRHVRDVERWVVESVVAYGGGAAWTLALSACSLAVVRSRVTASLRASSGPNERSTEEQARPATAADDFVARLRDSLNAGFSCLAPTRRRLERVLHGGAGALDLALAAVVLTNLFALGMGGLPRQFQWVRVVIAVRLARTNVARPWPPPR